MKLRHLWDEGWYIHGLEMTLVEMVIYHHGLESLARFRVTIEYNLRWNKLQDVIPPEIEELKSLTHLYLSFNNFKGEIPKELANLPLLRYLYLHENRFIGRIPPELGTLQQLRHFYLNNNYLTGEIPAQLANLTNLEILHLSYNKMSGIMPSRLAHIPRLTSLYLDHNQFTGRIPDAFYKHTFLKEMYIEGNVFQPGVNPIGIHNVLEVSDTEFLVFQFDTLFLSFVHCLDVVRTDRTLVFYEKQENLSKLWEIHAVYAWFDIDVGYCQGSGRRSVMVTNTTVEIVVPENVIGSIYGENGSNLARLRQISGAKVIVHEPHPGATDRKVIISGTPDETQAA
ncbi:hypothetical protein TEA_025689 [Camellia sinensis var. sinensis]|uniref:K Homology domain-containing protein n=1 Tax=Camellia sinensis var. sinensis TaxID=542762 RepID=A0A4S4D7J7_CAMSN|nr:hypothetical protein TEA_025689 [Camellia sinensis var. sinensis]